MTAKDLEGKTYEEVSSLFDAELDEYKNKVDSISEISELEELEKDLMIDLDEINGRLKTVKYDLPDGVDFEGTRYSKGDIAKNIIYFLNKNEVEWSYTLGLYELVKLWKSKDFVKISYNEFDSTLRTLNQVKFKGFDEWKNILAINEYMKKNHDSYTKDTALLLLGHKKHEAVLDRMQHLQTATEISDDQSME